MRNHSGATGISTWLSFARPYGVKGLPRHAGGRQLLSGGKPHGRAFGLLLTLVGWSFIGGQMNQRRKLTLQEREEAGAETRRLNPDKRVFVQEWTDADGKPIILTLREQ
jgi:hypothetical protein